MGMFEAFEKCVWNTILQCSCPHTSSTGDIIVLPFHSKNYIREIPTLVSPILLSWSWSQFSSDVSPWPMNCSWVYTRWWWWVKWYNHYITNLVMLPWCTEYLISQCKTRASRIWKYQMSKWWFKSCFCNCKIYMSTIFEYLQINSNKILTPTWRFSVK